jgi:hypothetical protein
METKLSEVGSVGESTGSRGGEEGSSGLVGSVAGEGVVVVVGPPPK